MVLKNQRKWERNGCWECWPKWRRRRQGGTHTQTHTLKERNGHLIRTKLWAEWWCASAADGGAGCKLNPGTWMGSTHEVSVNEWMNEREIERKSESCSSTVAEWDATEQMLNVVALHPVQLNFTQAGSSSTNDILSDGATTSTKSAAALPALPAAAAAEQQQQPLIDISSFDWSFVCLFQCCYHWSRCCCCCCCCTTGKLKGKGERERVRERASCFFSFSLVCPFLASARAFPLSVSEASQCFYSSVLSTKIMMITQQ